MLVHLLPASELPPKKAHLSTSSKLCCTSVAGWPWLAFWTLPIEILSPSQEHLCREQILHPDCQRCHCCAGLQRNGWRRKAQARKCHWFHFLRHQAMSVWNKKIQRLLQKKCFGELIQRRQRDSNPSSGRLFNLFGKTQRKSEIGLKKANETTSTSKENQSPFTLFIDDAWINKNAVCLYPSFHLPLSFTPRPAFKHIFFISSRCHHGNVQCPTWASLCFQRFSVFKAPPLFFSKPKTSTLH